MNVLEWLTVIFVILAVIIYVGDSFALFVREIKTSLDDDGRIDREELTKIEARARLVVRGVLKLIGVYRTL